MRVHGALQRGARLASGVLLAAVAALAGSPAPAAEPLRLPDTIAQRAAACIACHGRVGAIGNAGYYPRLAGKPAGYLFNQLLSFRDGRRSHADMNYMVRHLSDAYLRELAAYFASLDYPYPPPAASDAASAVLARGAQLVLRGDAAREIPACTQCHGAALTGVQPGIPGLVGLPRLYVASQLGAWLGDERHALAPDCMAQVGRRLSTDDVNAVASWLATQPVPTPSSAVAALPHPLPLPCSALPP